MTDKNLALNHSILVVDDDSELRTLIANFLVEHGFDVATARNGADMDQRLSDADYDLIVLDIMMPGESGLSIARRMAERSGPPVILLSALGADTDRIVGLEIGADDYLPKPCNPRELLARIRAVLRRRDASRNAHGHQSVYCFAGWELDQMRRTLKAPDDQQVAISEGELSVLLAFVEHPQRVLTRDQLLYYARGEDSDAFDRAIDTQISRLRKKLTAHSQTDIIHTVRNQGYMFVARVERR